MLDPLDFENRPYLDALQKQRGKAFFSLLIENITLHFWRVFFWTLLFSGLWMLGAPTFFGKLGSYVITALFFMGAFYFIRKDVWSFTRPNKDQIDHRIEQASNIYQGQINALEDNLANPKKHKTRYLWEYAQKQFLKSFSALKAPRPKAILSRKDPSALRFIAVLVFISGLAVSGNEWQYRIMSGMFPFASPYSAKIDKSINLWIKPPQYTGGEQTHLIGHGKYSEQLNIPEGSEIRVRLHSRFGRIFPPVFKYAGKSNVMEDLGGNLFGFETIIEDGKMMSVSQAIIPRATWKYSFIIDMPPVINHDLKENEANNEDGSVEIIRDKMPSSNLDIEHDANIDNENIIEDEQLELPYEILNNGQVRFPLIVKDDYSVKELSMTMNINDMVEERPLGVLAHETRLVMSGPNMDLKISPIYDMTWHTWAGLPVIFNYEVIDHKGQKSSLPPIEITLPEREFQHPMAKSLISMRKRLAWEYNGDFLEIAKNLETLLQAPDYFGHDPVIFLAIRTASSRLFYANTKPLKVKEKTALAVIRLLWDSAIAIEDGDLSLAMRDLRIAQRALENAMRDPDSSEEEIAELMDDLSEMMANYFAELQREMQKRMAEGQTFPQASPEKFGQMITPGILSKLMQEMEMALRDGDEKRAQEIMSQIQRMMEMMDPSMTPNMPKDMQIMSEGINELQELIERQEILMDQTIKRADIKQHNERFPPFVPRDIPTLEEILKDFGMEGNILPKFAPKENTKPSNAVNDNIIVMENNESIKDPQQKEDTSSRHKAEQVALRYMLGQLMLDVAEHLDDIPETMGLAEQEMRGSENALGENNLQTSIPHQEKAIEYLKQAQDNLSKQFSVRMQQMVGIGMSGVQKYDPLGRPYGNNEEQDGNSHGSNVKIPDEVQKKRVDEILKLLRRRSGDLNREQEERDYLRRLLRQFY